MKNKYLTLTSGIILILILFFLNLVVGHANIDPLDVVKKVYAGDETMVTMLFSLRLRTLLAATMAGIALPVSGMMLQTLFNNPIAEPAILGVSSMSGLGVAVLIILSTALNLSDYGFVLNSWWMILFALLGAILALIIITIIAQKTANNASVLVSGMIIGTFASAVIGSFQFFSTNEDFRKYLNWSLGSFESMTWEQLVVLGIVVFIGILLSVLILKQLNVMLLGEKYAETMGVKVSNLRVMIILITGAFTAAISAFIGPLIFVGFIIPHLSRKMADTTNHNWLFPMNMLLGIIFLLLICFIRTILPISIPVNIITSLIGAPMTIIFLLKQLKFIPRL